MLPARRILVPFVAMAALVALEPPAFAEGARSGARAAAGAKRGKAAAKKHKKRTIGPVAAFPGFRLNADGSTQIFVQLTSPVPVEEEKGPNTLTYTLKGARVALRNNRHALVTTSFNTPVARARLVETDEDVKLVIELRSATTPTETTAPAEHGRAVVEVSFPPGDYLTAPDLPKVEEKKDDGKGEGKGDGDKAKPAADEEEPPMPTSTER